MLGILKKHEFKEARCKCGRLLTISIIENTLIVTPCEDCISEEAWKAYQFGYTEGYVLMSTSEGIN